ncbi:MAG: glycosyltransferase [Acidobacteria bacterium]|nr:glycosyltransferase [Acidobacteriota bacterium]
MASILYIVHRFWPYQGGSERYFFEIATRTAAEGHAVTVLTTDAWDAGHLHFRRRKRIEPLVERVDGITIRRFRVRHFFYQQRILPRLSRLIPTRYPVFDQPHPLIPGLHWWLRTTRQRFDLVHAGVFPHAPLIAAGARYCRRHRVPFVCQPMLNPGEPYRAMENQQFLSPKLLALLEPAAAIFTNTSYENEVLVDKGIPAEKITVAGPAVSPDEVKGGDGAAFRARHGVVGPMVLQISTQTHDKGSWHTIDAMRRLRDRHPDVTFVFIGSIEQDFVKFLDLQPESVRKTIRLLNYVAEQEKRDALAACDVFVMPSRADSFGIAYLEAWLYKKPVIGCFGGGVPRVIDEGQDGFLVPYGDSHMLAEYIDLLLADRTRAAAMGARGHDKVMTRHRWDDTHAVVQDVYRRCLDRTPPRTAPRRVLRVGIDISRTIGESTGVGSYAASLVDALADIDHTNQYLLYPYFWECFPPAFRSARVPSQPNFRLWTRDAPLEKIRRRWLAQTPDAAAGNVDIVHSTGYTSPALGRSRLVVAVHDLSFVTHPEFHTEANRQFCLREVEKAARHAAMIIVPSQNTKRDLQRHYGVPDERLAVIPYAASPEFGPVADADAIRRVLRRRGIDGDYLLFVGSVEPRKNLAGLVRAAVPWLRREGSRRHIVVAGPAGWLNSDVHRLVNTLDLGRVVHFLGYVDREELRVLNAGARAFVYPSFYEGFGFPVLEAMACGAPVIASTAPAIEEIASGAARLVAPESVDHLRQAIEDVADHDEERARLRRLGLERAARYTWRETARRTLEVYEAVARS